MHYFFSLHLYIIGPLKKTSPFYTLHAPLVEAPPSALLRCWPALRLSPDAITAPPRHIIVVPEPPCSRTHRRTQQLSRPTNRCDHLTSPLYRCTTTDSYVTLLRVPNRKTAPPSHPLSSTVAPFASQLPTNQTRSPCPYQSLQCQANHHRASSTRTIPEPNLLHRQPNPYIQT